MFIGGVKRPVIANIARAAEEDRLNDRVEINDPVVHKEDRTQLTLNHLRYITTFRYRISNIIARTGMFFYGAWINRDTKYVGLENARKVKSGAIVTSNHFNPLENLTVFQGMARAGHPRTYVVSEDTNFLMQGFIGFFMKNYDTVPITKSHDYLSHQFPAILRQILSHNRLVLIYPEEQMWFNYRRPRPGKHGAYDYAAEFGAPIIPCFTEIIDTGKPNKETTEFNKVRYVFHILDPIYPDPQLSAAENSKRMQREDYLAKIACYEKVYGKKIDDHFALDDIAGWIGGDPFEEAPETADENADGKKKNLDNPFA